MYLKVLFFILFPLFAFSQAPQKINFQSILRNTSGEVVANKSVSLKISILSGSISGSSVYSETHTKTTDLSGLISLQIGNGTILSGVFGNISWGNLAHFIKLEADFSGGSNYVLLGTQELMSVPYALYASKTDTSSLNLVNRFSSKVNVSDTSNMLNPYLRTANAVKPSNTSGIDGIYSWEYPEGLSKDIVMLSSSNLPYTVPSGKNLYFFKQVSRPIIGGVIYFEGGGGNQGLIFGEGTQISGFELVTSVQFGFLTEKTNKIIPVHFPLNSNLSYTVPIGKLFVLLGATEFYVGGKLSYGNTGPLILPENTILIGKNNYTIGFSGYLIDK
jgi:hypothetical protein